MTKKTLFFVLIQFTHLALFSQQSEVGNWLMYFGQNRITDELSLHTEVQYRNHTLIPNNTEQLLLRTGLNYHFKAGMLTTGYGHIGTHVYDTEKKSPEVEEHRIWQQFLTTNNIGRLKLEHRYRIEQRWVKGDYKNRFRYRLMTFVPLNRKKMETGAIFIGLYDEIFINGKQNYFDRNRLYGAIGYQMNEETGFQIGVLQQETAVGGKWYLQFAVAFNPDFRSE